MWKQIKDTSVQESGRVFQCLCGLGCGGDGITERFVDMTLSVGCGKYIMMIKMSLIQFLLSEMRTFAAKLFFRRTYIGLTMYSIFI